MDQGRVARSTVGPCQFRFSPPAHAHRKTLVCARESVDIGTVDIAPEPSFSWPTNHGEPSDTWESISPPYRRSK